MSTLPGQAPPEVEGPGGGPLPPARAPSSARRRLLGIVGGIVVLVFLAITVVDNWNKVSSYDWQLTPGWLLAGVVILLLFFLVSALAYEQILGYLHDPLPPERVTISVWARSLLGRYVPGNVMMVVGRVVMAENAGVPKRVTLAATVYEQALGIATAATGAFLLVLQGHDTPLGTAVWVLGIIPVGLILLHPRFFGPASAWALRKARREPLKQLLSGRQVVILLGWFSACTMMLALGVWALVHSAAGAQAGSPLVVGAGFLLAFVVAMAAFIVPSGLGVRDGAFALVLAQSLPAGVAVAIAVGVRFAMIAIELVFVGIATLVGRRR